MNDNKKQITELSVSVAKAQAAITRLDELLAKEQERDDHGRFASGGGGSSSDAKVVNGYEIKPGANLRDANLSGADLHNAHLSNADLRGADLSHANLSGAKLNDANLSDASLVFAKLSGADLRDAKLNDANLAGANLSGANLTSANLGHADLGSANLSGANLTGANLSDARFNSTNLSNANLSGADLHNAYLSNADLAGANLAGANLRDASLDGAKLSGANLEGANLNDAWGVPAQKALQSDLKGADLRKGTPMEDIMQSITGFRHRLEVLDGHLSLLKDMRTEGGQYHFGKDTHLKMGDQAADNAKAALGRLQTAVQNEDPVRRDRAAHSLLEAHNTAAEHYAAAGDHDSAKKHQTAAAGVTDFQRIHDNKDHTYKWGLDLLNTASQSVTDGDGYGE